MPILIVFHLLLSRAWAQGMGENLNFIEKMILEEQLKHHLLKGNRSVFDAKTECPKRYKEAHKFWLSLPATKKTGPQIEGAMAKAFTQEEVLTMGMTNIHGLKSKVRGTDKYLPGGYSLSGVPGFPHALPGCENFYQEEVEVKKIDGRHCREIKFFSPLNSQDYYFQSYCENDKNLFIRFPSSDNSVDCVHCR